jgi:hypothetical protein
VEADWDFEASGVTGGEKPKLILHPTTEEPDRKSLPARAAADITRRTRSGGRPDPCATGVAFPQTKALERSRCGASPLKARVINSGTMATPKLKNERVKVGDVVADYRAGRLVIPEFQRDYVWRKSKAPRLLDSLYRSFPVSTLLLWQSSEYAKARRSNPRPAAGRSMSWLIDGQQRVMTLSRAMSGDEGIEVVFNPETDEFSLVNAATRHDRNWIRVADLFDDAAFRELRRELPNSKKGQKSEAAFEKVRAIRDYEIPVVYMVDHSFDDAVDAFTRINSLGVRLKQQDIESAHVAARHSGLIADEVAPFTEELARRGYTRLTVIHLFRVCAFLARPDGRMRTPLHELPRAEVLAAWKRTEKATKDAQSLVRSELGYGTP